MDGLLTFLIFAVLFYVMMRFGCGAHMLHGHHGGHGSEHSNESKHIDPVCGKNVPQSEGYGKMHQGHLYRFCSRQCLDAFDAESTRYVGEQKGAVC
jgi:YHS domain-containing protein